MWCVLSTTTHHNADTDTNTDTFTHTHTETDTDTDTFPQLFMYVLVCVVLYVQEVCGLKWSFDERLLASGGNDNKLFVWAPNLRAGGG